jgi:plastocyanin
MSKCVLGVVFSLLACLTVVSAADIEGSIIIKHKLTRKKVTANAGAYDRGVAVTLGASPMDDPLSFERAHVVIYLEGDSSAQPGAPIVIEQKNRQFVPDLLVVPVGSTVSFPNLDPIFHNVFSLSKPKSFDLGNYPKGQTRTVTFSKPGVVFVNCRLHTNMAASIVVTPNRWSARSDAAGRFVLRNVPPGKQTIVAWHKSAGFFRKTVVTSEAHDATVSFEIPLDENGVVSAHSVAQR